MSKIIIKWINEEVRLSREVADLDGDFRDGYLLGELLFKYNQQSDFSSFVPTGTNDAKINNFKRLEPNLRTLGIFFNSRVASDIMAGKRGVMKTLLFELKTSLESFHRGALKGGATSRIVQVIEIEKPVYNKTMALTFDNGIRSSVTKSKEQSNVISNKTVGFHSSLDAKHSEDLALFESDVQRAKEISKQRKKHEKEFMQAWEENNIKQWKHNMNRSKLRREKELHESLHKTQAVQSARENANAEARENALIGIDQFEVTLKRELLKVDDKEDSASLNSSSMFKTAGGQPGTGVPELTYMNPDTLREGLVHTQQTLKERHDDLVLSQQAHTRRRKRFVREKESRQSQSILSLTETEISEQLLNLNKSEEVERLARARVLVHADVMRENAKNRMNRAASLKAEFVEKESAWRNLQAAREVQWVIKPRLAAQRERLSRLHAASASATSCDTNQLVSVIIDRVLDITDWVVCCRSVGSYKTVDDTPLPSSLWRDVQLMYSSDSLKVPPAIPLMKPSNVYEHLPYSLSARPLCSDQGWLMNAPFTSKALMSLDSSSMDDRMSIALSKADVDDFISAVAGVELPNADNVVSGKTPTFHAIPEQVTKPLSPRPEGAPPLPAILIPKTKTLVDNPAWLFETPVRYLLGGAIVECRCAANPLPDFSPLVLSKSDDKDLIPDTPLPSVPRIALCGPVDSLRNKLAASIKKQLSPTPLVIICVHELIQLLSKVEVESNDLVFLSILPETAEALRQAMMTDIAKGGCITDDTYVRIASSAIQSIDPSTGYILEDFPNTAEQAKLLLKALTGIDRSRKKEQPTDRASSYLPVKEAAFVDYDKSFSVFDAVVHVNPVDADEPVEFRIRCRRNLRDGTVIVLQDDATSVVALSDIFSPDRPHELLSVSLSVASEEMGTLLSFFSDLSILKSVNVASYNDADIDNAAAGICTQFTKPVTKDITETTALTCDDTEESAETQTGAESVATATAPAPATGDPTASVPLPLVINHVTPGIHIQVAKALVSLWNASENQSTTENFLFFEGVRDIRYRVLQRRRCMLDVISKSYNKRDGKQALVDAFITNFNGFEQDFRYDSDLKAELHLRTLELRSELYSMAQSRMQDNESRRVKILADGAVAVAIHCVQGSAVALVQSEVNRFKTGMNIIHDYLKSVAAYNYTGSAFNSLEECAPLSEDMYDISSSGVSLGASAAGKDAKAAAKPKGGKDAKALRNPVAPIIFNKNVLLTLPEPSTSEEGKVEETTGKGKAASKPKGVKAAEIAPVGSNPLESVEQGALALAEYYSQGRFSGNRELFNGNESIADVLDAVVWHEAERLKFAVSTIKEYVVKTTTWISQQEEECGEQLSQFIKERYLRELACTEALTARIIRAIEDFSPIREQWLIAPDAFCVVSESLILPLPLEPPTPVLHEFPASRMNQEQINVMERAIYNLQLGGLVLLEDVEEWLHKSSLPGAPLGNITCTSDVDANLNSVSLSNLNLPSYLLKQPYCVSTALKKEILETRYSDTGVCPATTVVDTMSKLEIFLDDIDATKNEEAVTNNAEDVAKTEEMFKEEESAVVVAE